MEYFDVAQYKDWKKGRLEAGLRRLEISDAGRSSRRCCGRQLTTDF
ncbi:MAG TPA: hypothetical protein VFZ76_12130 [Anaerolineales bacterium]